MKVTNKEINYKIGNHMNKKIPDEDYKELLSIKRIYTILDKLEQRISSLEKVLESHAKCIGEMRDKEDE